MEKGIAVAVMVVTPQGIPTVMDPTKPAPVLEKLPGGKGHPGEDAQQCAARELEEEIGISVDEFDLRVITEEDRGSHIFTAFCIQLNRMPKGLKTIGDEGEMVNVRKPREIRAMRSQILRPHLGIIERGLAMLGL